MKTEVVPKRETNPFVTGKAHMRVNPAGDRFLVRIDVTKEPLDIYDWGVTRVEAPEGLRESE